jgi:pseudaminic acid cytidylyltransferase
MNIAIIPARGGSKRIPRKNIKLFHGRPIISYSIQAALGCGVFDRVIVSTDDDEIARVAKAQGAEVPFLRPDSLSQDNTPTAPVITHADRYLQENGVTADRLCCIYATAPFIRAEYLRQGEKTLRSHGVGAVISVTSFAFPIFRALKLDADDRMTMFWPENEMRRSQDLPEAYHDAGQFYWLDAPSFRENERLYATNMMPVIIPRYLVQDIDTLEDWLRAEAMYVAVNAAN